MIYQLQVPGPIKDVAEVRVLEWHVQPGQGFAAGDLIVEVETHKAVVELRAEQPGFLRRILSAEGDWQQVGAPLAMVADNTDEALPEGPDGLPPLPFGFEVT